MAIKVPKKVNNMTLDEQETYFSNKLKQNEQEYYELKKYLGQVRGGMKVQARVEDTPGLDYAVEEMKKQ